MRFFFEELTAYQLALEWANDAENLRRVGKKRISGSLLQQLHRASTSIPLNLAEAAGRITRGEQRQFLGIARGSIFECKAIIDILLRQKFLSADLHARYSGELRELQALVTGLIAANTPLALVRSIPSSQLR